MSPVDRGDLIVVTCSGAFSFVCFVGFVLLVFTVVMPITSKPYVEGARQAIHDGIVSVFPETRVYWEGVR